MLYPSLTNCRIFQLIRERLLSWEKDLSKIEIIIYPSWWANIHQSKVTNIWYLNETETTSVQILKLCPQTVTFPTQKTCPLTRSNKFLPKNINLIKPTLNYPLPSANLKPNSTALIVLLIPNSTALIVSLIPNSTALIVSLIHKLYLTEH